MPPSNMIFTTGEPGSKDPSFEIYGLKAMSVHSVRPNKYFTSQLGKRSVLLAVAVVDSAYGGPISADPPVQNLESQRLLAIHPEELRKLARQLEKAADQLDQG